MEVVAVEVVLPEVSDVPDCVPGVDLLPPSQPNVLTAAGRPALTGRSPREDEEPRPALTTSRPSPALTARLPWTRRATRCAPRSRESAVTRLSCRGGGPGVGMERSRSARWISAVRPGLRKPQQNVESHCYHLCLQFSS